MQSIIQKTEQCYFCGSRYNLETHHIFFGNPGRKISDKNGFTVRLCADCHKWNRLSPHRNRKTDLVLKKTCQQAYEAQGHSREEFIKLVGRNYLDL